MKSAVLCLLLGGKYASAGSSGDYDYDHQDEWADSYSMCDNNDQSPIDIDTSNVVNDDDICTKDFAWDLNYNHSSFLVVNTGFSLKLQPVQQVSIDPTGEYSDTYFDKDGEEYHTLSANDNTIGKFDNNFRPSSWRADEHETFCLDSFHFHWGTSDLYGSEHYIDGVAFPLELHFVHYSCDHSSLSSTLEDFPTEDDVKDAEAAGEDVYQLGVVGIFFDVVNESNPAFDAIFGLNDGHLDNIQYPNKRNWTEVITDLNLADLIPDDIATEGYYAYEGSLTTPPCTDIVRWHVMEARGTIGVDQMDQFRQLLYDAYGTNSAPNYREIQENVNTVYACMEGEATPEVEESADETTTFAVIAVYGTLIMICQCLMGVICCYKNKRSSRGDKSQPIVPATTNSPSTTDGHH